MEDFNPFDLSAPPKRLEEQLNPKEPIRPKAMVKRVSMGPIFHSRITRILALVGGVILAALIGYSATNYYLNKKDAANIQTSVITPTTQSQKSTDSTTTSEQVQSKDTATSQTDTNSTNTAPPVSTPAPATSPAKVYCGVSGMPEGVCTAIASIEKDGIKNNKYVTADTSQLPDGTTVDVNQQSWFQGGAELGNVTFSAKASGHNLTGSAYFQLTNNMWKVISYTINQ